MLSCTESYLRYIPKANISCHAQWWEMLALGTSANAWEILALGTSANAQEILVLGISAKFEYVTMEY